MLAAAVALALAAPSPVHLSALLAEAKKQNPTLRALAAKARAAHENAQAAGALDDPMLMVQLYQAPVDFANVPLMLSVSQKLPLGGKIASRKAEAASMADGAGAALEAAERDVEARVTRDYVDLYLADRTVEIDAEVRKTLTELEKAAAARVVAGEASEAETLEIEGEIVAIDGDDAKARAKRDTASADLSAALGEEAPATFGRAAAPSVVAVPAEATLLAKAFASRPELAQARAMIGAAQARLALAKESEVPDIGLSLGAMHVFAGTGGEGTINMISAGVSGNLPVFWRSKNEPRIDAAGERLDEARAMEAALRAEVAGEVAAAYAKARAATQLVAIDQKLIPLARETVRTAIAGYIGGKAEFTLVLDGVRRELGRELSLVRDLASFEESLVGLDRAVGAGSELVAQSQPTAEPKGGAQ